MPGPIAGLFSRSRALAVRAAGFIWFEAPEVNGSGSLVVSRPLLRLFCRIDLGMMTLDTPDDPSQIEKPRCAPYAVCFP